MENNSQSSATQFRPMVPNQPFSQQFQGGGQFSQPMQQYPSRPGQPMPSSQYVQTRPVGPGPPQHQQPAPPFSTQMPGFAGSGVPFSSSSYSFPPSSFVNPQNNAGSLAAQQYPPMSQMQAPAAPVAGQPWLSSGTQIAPSGAPAPVVGQQPSSSDAPTNVSSLSQQQSSSDWQEHSSGDGRRYYYNKNTRQSVWDKPLELMTPIEKADASTVWKEYTSSDGRKYYYNKATRASKWTIPEELKLARELALKEAGQGVQSEAGGDSNGPAAVASSEATGEVVSVTSSNSLAVAGVALSPVSVTPVASLPDPSPVVTSGSPAIPASLSIAAFVATQPSLVTVVPLNPAISAGIGVSSALNNTNTNPARAYESPASQDVASSVDGASIKDIEEAKKGMAVAGKINVTPVEEKSVDDEPLLYTNKLEAKTAFKSLLESANVQSDWTWDQTMREIVKDKRYGVLKTLGERKQAFNEYLGQRRKLEAEERRMRQKKAREEFSKMLEESKELTSSTRWSKAVTMFENDDRFKAVERARDKEDLFENHIVELERKEKEKALEEHRRNVAEFRKFLQSCDFVKVNSQWRKVQDRIEDDERCLCLEKLDRLLIYQDHIRDLEKEDEEQKKIQKDNLRRVERKNRDEFRKLIEEHINDGIITAKTQWRDYCLKVKDLPQYHAVASNTSGSTPKDLYEDVVEELEKEYHDEKTRVKDALKSAKVSIASSWTFDDFKAAIAEDVGSPPISDINLKLVFEDLLERAREKEEKDAKKRQRLADDFTKLLHTLKEITTASNWEECKHLFDESQEYRSIGDDVWAKEIFDEYVVLLHEKAKEKERKREEDKGRKEREREEKEKRKEKDRKEKDRERDKGKDRSKNDDTDSENMEIDTHSHKEDRKREKDRDRKHRKRHQSATEELGSDRDEKEDSKKRKHSSSGDRKKSRKHGYSPESDNESRHRKHRRDHRESRRNGGPEELEDGELGEDGEIP